MPKRSAEEKLLRYNNKIKKLQDKIKKKRKPSIIYSDEEENAEVSNYMESIRPSEPPALVHSELPITIESTPYVPMDTIEQDLQDNEAIQLSDTQEVLPSVTEPVVELNSDILSALGAMASDTAEFGKKIHETLANLWSPLLKKGLPKEEKEKLFKEFIVPENCKNLQAPKLNAEISAAITDLARARDKKILNFQQQLGYGMTAINRAMDLLIAKEENKINVLKCLSDGCRILSDLHFTLTKDRTKLVLPSLDNNFRHVIQDSERDDTLFGNSLSEKIKASKAIEKQGAQIKKITSKVTNNQPTTATRSTHPRNWAGPPRYPSNRGGRGGLRKGPAAQSAPRRSYSNPAPKFTQARARAPTQM